MIIYDNLVMHIMVWSVHAFLPFFACLFFHLLFRWPLANRFLFSLICLHSEDDPNQTVDTTPLIQLVSWFELLLLRLDRIRCLFEMRYRNFPWDFHFFKFSLIDWLIDWRSMDDEAIPWKRVYFTIAIISRAALWNWQWTIATSGCYWHDRT